MVAIVIASAPPGCIAPPLAGLTERAAARRARASGCRIRFRGAALKEAAIQTVAIQTPLPGARTSVVTVRLNPLCERSAAAGPPPDQGHRRGRTELITGLFIEGGPALPFSTPGCRHPPGTPVAGTIDVLGRSGAAVLRSRTITRGRYVTFRLPPGHYRISGRIGRGLRPLTAPVTIRGGFTTRRYLVAPVP